MGWTMLYLFVFLKLPIVAAGYIVWWAVSRRRTPTTLPTAAVRRSRAVRTRAGRAARVRRAVVVRAAVSASRPRRACARSPRRAAPSIIGSLSGS